MSKLNFGKKPKRNFDWINCWDVENRVVREGEGRVGQRRGRGKQVLPAQLPILGTNCYVRGTRLTTALSEITANFVTRPSFANKIKNVLWVPCCTTSHQIIDGLVVVVHNPGLRGLSITPSSTPSPRATWWTQSSRKIAGMRTHQRVKNLFLRLAELLKHNGREGGVLNPSKCNITENRHSWTLYNKTDVFSSLYVT